MLRSIFCDYSGSYVLVKGTITVAKAAAVGSDANNNNKKVVTKNCAPFTDWMSEINNALVDNSKYIDVVMPMYNLTEYNDNCSKT